jgi:tryptophan 2,3-dioxygenase
LVLYQNFEIFQLNYDFDMTHTHATAPSYMYDRITRSEEILSYLREDPDNVNKMASAIIESISGSLPPDDQQIRLLQNLKHIISELLETTASSSDLPENLERCIFWYKHHYDIHPISPAFLGYHQLFEVILFYISSALDNVVDELDAVDNIDPIKNITSAWYILMECFRIMSKLDRSSYLSYIMRLNKVSGANSPQMIPVTMRTYKIEEKIFANLEDSYIYQILKKPETDPELYKLMSRVMDMHDAVSRTWMNHLVTATTTIGITKGTQGTPNSALVDRVLHGLFNSRLLRILGSVREHIDDVGIEIKYAMELSEYPLTPEYIFVKTPPNFGTHSMGIPPIKPQE